MASRRSSTSSSSSSDSGVLVSTPTSSSSEPSIPGQPFVLPSRPKDTEPTKPSEQIKIASASTPNEPAKNTDLGKEKKAVKTTKPVQPAKKGKQTKSSTDPVIAITPAKKIVKSTTSSPYWLQFPSFKHDCNAALNGQFSKLAAHSGWKRKSKRYIEERTACYAAEYQHFFHPDGWSEGGKLEVWKVLCGAVGIKEEESITKCKKALKKVHINLMQLIDSLRAGTPPTTFKSRKQLEQFIVQDLGTRCFPLAAAKKDGFVKVFLLDVFHQG